MAGYFIPGSIPTAQPGPPAPIIAGAGAVPYGQQAADINQFMTGQALAPYLANLPGYANMVGQRSQNTQSMLAGQIPGDVVNTIAQGAAERGIAGGAPTGPNANAAYLRALGLTSLDMMGRGSQELTQSIADTPVPELWNPASLWVPTVLGQQEGAAAERARQQEENRAAMAANNEAASRGWTRSGYYMGGTWRGSRNPLAMF